MEGQGGTDLATYAQSGGTNPAHVVPQLLTVAQVATTLAVEAATVQELVATGELRAVRVAGQLRFTVVALEQFLAAAKVGPSGKR